MERPDEWLVAASRNGENDTYSELVRRHLKRVFAICLGLLGDVPDAEDAVQEVFVRGFERLCSLRDDRRFASWISQIARNHCRDLLRSRNRRPDRPMTPAIEETAKAPIEEFDDLRAALARLPEEHRLPLLLFYFDGKDTKSLARELGLTQGGACARLYRARRHLRRLLAEEVTSHE